MSLLSVAMIADWYRSLRELTGGTLAGIIFYDVEKGKLKLDEPVEWIVYEYTTLVHTVA